MNRTSRRAAIQVGIAGLLSIVLLFVGIAWLKEYRVGKRKTYYTARFDEVGNLSEGDPVAVRGVRKGAVTKITLEEQGVRVEFEVDRGVVLHPDAQLRVSNIGFMGEKFLALDAGSAPGRYDRSKPIPGRFQSGVPEVIAGAGDLLTETTELSSRLNLMLDSIDPATVERASKNFEKATAGLSQTLDQNRTGLRTAIEDFRVAAHDLRQIASTNSEQVSSSIRDFGEASRRLSKLSDQLSTTATALDRVVTRLDEGQGALGKAIADSTLYVELKETLQNTNQLVKDIRKNPKKYLKLSVF
jgi:phospholipid/cholesterol/gamma-HCH transport system substrate-binding protein